jgi:hypothetical protein
MNTPRTESDVQTTLLAKADQTVDVDAMLRRVQRRVRGGRRRRWVGGAVAVALLTVGATLPVLLLRGGVSETPAGFTRWTIPSGTAGDCTVTALTMPAGSTVPVLHLDPPDQRYGRAFPSMDPTGRFVAVIVDAMGLSSDDKSTWPFLVRWDNGRPERLPDLPEGLIWQVGGRVTVNEHGVVAGTAEHVNTYGEQEFSALVLDGDHWVQLSVPDGYETAGVGGITPDGRLLGTASTQPEEPAVASSTDAGYVVMTSPAELLSNPVIWSADSAHTPQVLTTPTWARATAIAPDGTVVGEAKETRPTSMVDPLGGYVWAPDGTGRYLPTLPGSDTRVQAMRGDWVLGYAYDSQKVTVLRWNLRTGEAQVMDVVRPFYGINARGDVVTMVNDNDAVLVRDGQVHRLVPQDPSVAGPHVAPSVLSDDGTTVVGIDTTTADKPFVVWHC